MKLILTIEVMNKLVLPNERLGGPGWDEERLPQPSRRQKQCPKLAKALQRDGRSRPRRHEVSSTEAEIIAELESEAKTSGQEAPVDTDSENYDLLNLPCKRRYSKPIQNLPGYRPFLCAR